MISLWTRLRFASAAKLGSSAALALVASLALDKSGVPGAGLLAGVLLALAVWLGIVACGVWQRTRARA